MTTTKLSAKAAARPYKQARETQDEVDALREELLQCRAKLALAAESAAGDDELRVELIAALTGTLYLFEGCTTSRAHQDHVVFARNLIARCKEE